MRKRVGRNQRHLVALALLAQTPIMQNGHAGAHDAWTRKPVGGCVKIGLDKPPTPRAYYLGARPTSPVA